MIEKCLPQFATNTNIFNLLFKELKTDCKNSFLPFAVTRGNVKVNLSNFCFSSRTAEFILLKMRKVITHDQETRLRFEKKYRLQAEVSYWYWGSFFAGPEKLTYRFILKYKQATPS